MNTWQQIRAGELNALSYVGVLALGYLCFLVVSILQGLLLDPVNQANSSLLTAGLIIQGIAVAGMLNYVGLGVAVGVYRFASGQRVNVKLAFGLMLITHMVVMFVANGLCVLWLSIVVGFDW